MSKDYTIKRDENGCQIVKIKIEWVDENNQPKVVETDDLDAAGTVIGLLNGEICLADLEP